MALLAKSRLIAAEAALRRCSEDSARMRLSDQHCKAVCASLLPIAPNMPDDVKIQLTVLVDSVPWMGEDGAIVRTS